MKSMIFCASSPWYSGCFSWGSTWTNHISHRGQRPGGDCSSWTNSLTKRIWSTLTHTSPTFKNLGMLASFRSKVLPAQAFAASGLAVVVHSLPGPGSGGGQGTDAAKGKGKCTVEGANGRGPLREATGRPG